MRVAPRPPTSSSPKVIRGGCRKAAARITEEVAIDNSSQKESARRNANSHFAAWEQRTALVKQQAATESAANDAKTIRLRALRLAKEEEDKKAEALAPKAAKSSPSAKKRS
jgi:hypothetical protein